MSVKLNRFTIAHEWHIILSSFRVPFNVEHSNAYFCFILWCFHASEMCFWKDLLCHIWRSCWQPADQNSVRFVHKNCCNLHLSMAVSYHYPIAGSGEWQSLWAAIGRSSCAVVGRGRSHSSRVFHGSGQLFHRRAAVEIIIFCMDSFPFGSFYSCGAARVV